MMLDGKLWDPWLGTWSISQVGGGTWKLTLAYDPAQGLTGKFIDGELANVWLMWIRHYGRSVLSADFLDSAGRVPIVLSMQKNVTDRIWGASPPGPGRGGAVWVGIKDS